MIVISADLDGRSDAARAAGAATTLDKRDFVPRTLDALWQAHKPDGRSSPVASTRSPESRMNALRQANQVRSLRAKLKQDLREGTVRLEQILATRAGYLATAQVFDLLVAVPKIGPVKAAHLLNLAHISPSKTVVALSERQRARLIELLRLARACASSRIVGTRGALPPPLDRPSPTRVARRANARAGQHRDGTPNPHRASRRRGGSRHGEPADFRG